MAQGKGERHRLSKIRRPVKKSLREENLERESAPALSPKKVRQLGHELQVYQTELETQNEELREAQLQLERLKRLKNKYLNLYEFAPVGYLALNNKGLILEANLAATLLLGVTRKKLVKRFFSRFVWKEDGDTFYLYLKKVLATQSKQACEIRVVKGDGTLLFVQLEAVPAEDESGESDLLRVTLSDITQRKHAEEEVRKFKEELEIKVEERTAELRLANEKLILEIKNRKRAEQIVTTEREGLYNILETLPAMVCLLTPDHHIAFANRSFREKFGEEDNGRRCFEHCFGRNESCDFCEAYNVLKSGVPHNWQVVLPDGSIIDVHDFPFADSDGKPLILEMDFDITDRKRAEEALRQSEQRFRAIFEGAEDYIFIKDSNLRYVQVNPALAGFIGKDPSALIGSTAEDIYGSAEGSEIRRLELRALRGETVEGERKVLIEGTHAVHYYSFTPLRDVEGKITGIFGIVRDVTDRKPKERYSTKAAGQYPSRAMRATLSMARRAAQGGSVVLLLGESGSGKDYVAKYIHDHSHRSNGPYFSLNCAAIAPGLAESELFGHEKGAFTGAVGRKRGILELAEGGSLLLNEIGDLSPPLQAKLLTFLDTRKFTRVGGEKEITANARLMAATNRDLEKQVEEGSFRKDLFYRLNVVSIEIPPLRDRLEDIPVLVEEITSRLASELQLHSIPLLDDAALQPLISYPWPGNVRELRNVLERALILSEGGKIEFPDLLACLDNGSPQKSFSTYGRTLPDLMDELTKSALVDALSISNGNKSKAAQTLGIARDSLYRYMKKFGMETGD